MAFRVGGVLAPPQHLWMSGAYGRTGLDDSLTFCNRMRSDQAKLSSLLPLKHTAHKYALKDPRNS